MNFRIRNRWLVVIGAISSQLAIGALYAWSHFNEPIATAFSWTIPSVYTTYTIALATFALTMNFTGWLQLKLGILHLLWCDYRCRSCVHLCMSVSYSGKVVPESQRCHYGTSNCWICIGWIYV
ncbi:MAG: hypothetical protein ACTSP5_16545 [Candidatus Heimdallarchaeota archaeon]